jgi:hypothetical protein
VKCEKCGGKVATLDTRQVDIGIWRQRGCAGCGDRFTTIEQRCETLKVPFVAKKNKVLAQGKIITLPVPAVTRPNPENKRAVVMRRAPQPKPEPERTDPPIAASTLLARDRIEDMRFDREQSRDHGWDL